MGDVHRDLVIRAWPPPPDGYPLARVLRDEGCGVLFAARAMEAAL